MKVLVFASLALSFNCITFIHSSGQAALFNRVNRLDTRLLQDKKIDPKDLHKDNIQENIQHVDDVPEHVAEQLKKDIEEKLKNSASTPLHERRLSRSVKLPSTRFLQENKVDPKDLHKDNIHENIEKVDVVPDHVIEQLQKDIDDKLKNSASTPLHERRLSGFVANKNSQRFLQDKKIDPKDLHKDNIQENIQHVDDVPEHVAEQLKKDIEEKLKNSASTPLHERRLSRFTTKRSSPLTQGSRVSVRK